MQKVELLAPAGTMEALQAAVQNGCDAVYLGGTLFGARAFAGNFDNDEMLQAIQYAHLYGVKVYVTMNTLIFEDEMDAAYEYAKFLYTQGVDALIVQDLGLFDRLRIQLPNLELHASTQMHIHNVEGIRLLKKLGAQRIVLPRETTIEEVRAFAKEGIALEVFVHGALCISYSGQCLMSEALFQRSGNRGECAQACRMKYHLIKDGNEVPTDGEYLLSPRDLNTLEHIPELIEAGITSFKIEGRMKRPEYVAQVVSLYRQAIDAYAKGHKFIYDHQAKQALNAIFNRKFTSGHLFHEEGKQLMHAFRPNHMGIPIGRVIRANQKRIAILLQGDIHQGDGIRILQTKEDQGFLLNKIYLHGLLVKEAKKGDIIELDCSHYIEVQAPVVKTSDVLQLQRLQSRPKRTIAITMQAQFQIGQPMKLEISDDIHTVTVTSNDFIQCAKTAATKKDRIKEQLIKCGDSPFHVESITITADEQCFIPIKELNQLRRQGIEALKHERIKCERVLEEAPYNKVYSIAQQDLPYEIIIVHTESQYEACLQAGFQPRYTTSREVADQYGLSYSEGNIVQTQDTSPLVWEAGGLTKTNRRICEPALYAANSYACAFLQSEGMQQIILPYELSMEQIQLLLAGVKTKGLNTLRIGMEVYGYRDLMVVNYCPIATYESGHKHCQFCHQSEYHLEDVKGQRYFLMGDAHCRMHILFEKPYDKIKDIAQYRKMGISVLQIRFTKESAHEVMNILNSYKKFTDL